MSSLRIIYPASVYKISIWIMRRRKCFHALRVIIFIAFPILFSSQFPQEFILRADISPFFPCHDFTFFTLLSDWFSFYSFIIARLSLLSCVFPSFLPLSLFFNHSLFLCLSQCFLRIRFSSVVHSFWNICLSTLSFLQYAFINLRFSLKEYNLL